VGKFAASIKCPKTKSASASVQGASNPCPGALPLDPEWGLCPQTPVIGSHYCARHGAVPPRCWGLEPPLKGCLVTVINILIKKG